MEDNQQWFDGDYYGKCYEEELNLKFGIDGRAKNSAAIRRKANKKPFEGEVISCAKIERKMNKLLADEEEGRRRLAEAKVRCAASSDLIAKALAPRRNSDPIERLKKFSVDVMKQDQRDAKNSKNKNLKDVIKGYQLFNFNDGDEKLETLQDPYDSSRGLKYSSRSAFGDVNFNRAFELKQLLEQRERYFNGEMDEVYYKTGPDGNSIPKPPSVRIKSSRSTSSNRQNSQNTAFKIYTENLDSVSKQVEFQKVEKVGQKITDIQETVELSDEVDYLGEVYPLRTSSEYFHQTPNTLQNERRSLPNCHDTIDLKSALEQLSLASEPDLNGDKVDGEAQIKYNSKSEPVMGQNSAIDIMSYQKKEIANKRGTMKMPIRLNSAYSAKTIKAKKSKPKQPVDRKSGPFKP